MRKFLLGLFAIALSMSLVACGNSEEAISEETNEEENEEVSTEGTLVFEDNKVTLDDGTEVTLGASEDGANIVVRETAVLPDGEKVLSTVTYVYDGETLTDVTIEMTARTNDYAKILSEDESMIGAGVDPSSVKVKGTKVFAKMDEATIAEMASVPRSMMVQVLVK